MSKIVSKSYMVDTTGGTLIILSNTGVKDYCKDNNIAISDFNMAVEISFMIEDCSYMFDGCTSFNQHVIVPSSGKNLTNMFRNCKMLTKLVEGEINVDPDTVFCGCPGKYSPMWKTYFGSIDDLEKSEAEKIKLVEEVIQLLSEIDSDTTKSKEDRYKSLINEYFDDLKDMRNRMYAIKKERERRAFLSSEDDLFEDSLADDPSSTTSLF